MPLPPGFKPYVPAGQDSPDDAAPEKSSHPGFKLYKPKSEKDDSGDIWDQLPQGGDWPGPSKKPEQAPEVGGGSQGVVDQLAQWAGPALRGAAPATVGAAVGAAMGAPFEGVGAVPGAALGATAMGLADLGVTGYNALGPERVGLPRAPTSQDLSDWLLDKAGVPRPQTAGQRMGEATAGGLAGGIVQSHAATTLAQQLAPGITKRIMTELGRGAGQQAAAGAAAGASAQGAAEMGYGPGASLIAGILGSSVAGLPFRPTPVKGPTERAARAATSEEIGFKPPVSFIRESPISKGFEQAAASTREGSARREALSASIGNYVSGIVKATGTDLSPNEANAMIDKIGKAKGNVDAAGRYIQEALGGKDGFIERSRSVENGLWDRWFAHVEKSGQEMPVSNTLAFLDKVTATHPGASRTSAATADPYLTRLKEGIKEDIAKKGSATVPYEVMKDLRTKIGERTNPRRMVPEGMSESESKGLYAAMSKDMEEFANSLGGSAAKDFKNANAFTRGFHARIDRDLGAISKQHPYDVWAHATNPKATEGGGHRFLVINRSLTPEQRETFHATFINQMGRTRENTFDPLQFSNNYKALAPEVQKTLFTGKRREAVERVVGAIDDLNRVGAIGKAPNTTTHLVTYMVLSAIMHGKLKGLAMGAAAVHGAEKTLNWLSGKQNTEWLAKEWGMSPVNVTKMLGEVQTSLRAGQGSQQVPKRNTSWDDLLSEPNQ